ncbi:phytase [Deinococcus cellulosilyticus]|uniref:phytase n=1 Tax=Deinococcus cellulosilyticus TaxID=401558 RepID=UPI001FE4B9D7|nr:phytase [Deinococcus cellulosilyticus]
MKKALITLTLMFGFSAHAQMPSIPALYETAVALDPADSDDPAIWVHPTHPSLSMVVATHKDAGLTVFDLSGRTLQDINPGNVRYNNVDVVYGFRLGNRTVDLAIASDRKNDRLAIFEIQRASRKLKEVTQQGIPLVFTAAGAKSDGTNTAYGLAAYQTREGQYRVFVSQRKHGRVAELELVTDGKTVGSRLVRFIDLPQQKVDDPQVEGMVVDTDHGILYMGQEKVGIWKLSLQDAQAQPQLIHAVKPTGQHLEADVEGLTIYDAGNGQGYLLASSQGDNTFVVYDRQANNRYLGSFKVAGGSLDGSEECDGAMVSSINFGPRFPQGLLVVQDGYVKGVEGQTNFKLVSWTDIAEALGLQISVQTAARR